MGMATTTWHFKSHGRDGYCGAEESRNPLTLPHSFIIEQNKPKPLHCGELALMGALRRLSSTLQSLQEQGGDLARPPFPL